MNTSTAHIVITYFDDQLGQQALSIVPEFPESLGYIIFTTIAKLADLHLDTSKKQFIYADGNFSSQNIRFSVLNSNSRGGFLDYLISVVLIPSNAQNIQTVIAFENFIPAIQEVCEQYLINLESSSYIEIRTTLNSELISIISELTTILNESNIHHQIKNRIPN